MKSSSIVVLFLRRREQWGRLHSGYMVIQYGYLHAKLNFGFRIMLTTGNANYWCTKIKITLFCCRQIYFLKITPKIIR